MGYIDFVITWVDGNDINWQKDKAIYSPSNDGIGNNAVRFRDWDNLQYWFRAVEKYAPWVNKIHFVTYGHLPKWLNVNHPKLNIANHSNFILNEYLPTFSSHPIELNMHRIKGLSENFVYFNDDTFLNAPVKETDFFINGVPRDKLIFDVQYPTSDQISNIIFNNNKLISKYVNKKFLLKKHFSKIFYPLYGNVGLKNYFTLPFLPFTGFYNHHLPISFTKTVFNQLWESDYQTLHETSLNKFRSNSDVNPWIFRYFNLAKGNIVPVSKRYGKLFEIVDNNSKLYSEILKSKYKMLCCNDAGRFKDFDKQKQNLIEVFECKYPNKSSYEL